MQIIAPTDAEAYLAAIARAECRARHSYFDSHVIKVREAGYLIIDEGDHPPLPAWMIERVVHSVAGSLSDEF